MTIDEKIKLVAKYVGYFQPKEAQDDLFSFEVYASIAKCKEEYPNEEIIRYFGDDIEDFQFIDTPLYTKDWNLLMPVLSKIEADCYEHEKLKNYIEKCSDLIWLNGLNCSVDALKEIFDDCVDFIRHKNKLGL